MIFSRTRLPTIRPPKTDEKSILILQKQGAELKAPREVLLAKVPNMTNKQALAMFFEKVQMWKENK